MQTIKFVAISIALVCLKAQLALSDVEIDYCYSDDQEPYLLAGTKTAYEIVHGLIKNTTVPNCKPLQIWMLIRHGTRNPDADEIQKMRHNLQDLQRIIIENHEKHGNGTLCQKDLENLKTWQLDPSLDKHHKKYLTKQGQIDLSSLGERFKNYFPELLQSNPVDILSDKYKFRSTDTQRTVASMKHFITGLFGNVTINSTEVVPPSEDTLLKLYKICKPWLEQVNNPLSSVEINKFISGPEFSQTVANVSQRLGFPHSLSFDDVLIMYTACTFENAWDPDKHSPWCAAFTEDDLKVFEYENDLYYYYHSSYGQVMSPKVGCPPLRDMFNRFSILETEDPSEEKQGIFYFTHSTSLQLFLTAMGIAEDPIPLTASNYKDNAERKWTTSGLAPFAANFAAVFYECDSANKVGLYFNEKPLDYEGCEMGICDWEFLKKKIGPNVSNCNIDFCNL